MGIDVAEVKRIREVFESQRERFVRRVYTQAEAAYCEQFKNKYERYAGRFAAKEAAVKALQPERHWTDWRAIEVTRDKSGRCGLVLHREAASLASRRGLRHLALSMSHDGDCAVAIVAAFRDSIQRPRRR